MANCGCNEYQCMRVFLNPCSEGVQLSINAGYTGDMTAIVSFNGVINQSVFGVVDGEAIVIPSALLNENYTHVLELYNEDNELVNDTCYTLDVRPSMNVAASSPLPPSGETFSHEFVIDNPTDTYTYAALDGKKLLTVSYGAQTLTADFFTQTGDSFTLIYPYQMIGTVVITYENN